MSQLKVGDVVRLKSGGPAMTIEQVHADKALCSWFEGSKTHKQMFPLQALELDDEPGSIEPDAT
jgi:uncharacterized protein YodC (DUF2158 family)